MLFAMLCVAVFLLFLVCVVWYFAWPIVHGVLPPASTNEKENPTVLITFMADAPVGGAEYYALSLYEALLESNPHIAILVAHQSVLHKELIKRNKPFISCRVSMLDRLLHHSRLIFKGMFWLTLFILHRRFAFSIMHCNNDFELQGARAFANTHKGHVVYTRHFPSCLKVKYLWYPHAIIGVSPFIADCFRDELKKQSLVDTLVTSIIPVFDKTRFESFLRLHPTLPTRAERNLFFEKTFGLVLNDDPALSFIARMPEDIAQKNHALLFRVMATLIHEKKKPVHALLAGDGPLRPVLEALARELNIMPYTHFLGFTSLVPEVLHYADFMVLTSNTEALGLVYLEAGYLKKASVGATKTGAEAVIVHEKTGLLYENGSVASALEAIEYCIDNPEKSKIMGLAAHQHIVKNFSPKVLGNKIQTLYKQVGNLL